MPAFDAQMSKLRDERMLDNELIQDLGRICQSNVTQCQDKLCSKNYCSYALSVSLGHPGGLARSEGGKEQLKILK